MQGDDSLLLSSRSPLTGLVIIAREHHLPEPKLGTEVASPLAKAQGHFSSKVPLNLAPKLLQGGPSVLQRVVQAVRAGDPPALLLGKSQALGAPWDCTRGSFGWCRDEVKSLGLCLEGRVPLILKCLTLWEAGLGACCQLNLCTPLSKTFSFLLPQ